MNQPIELMWRHLLAADMNGRAVQARQLREAATAAGPVQELVSAVHLVFKCSALHLASSNGFTENTELLLSARADVDAQADDSRTALHEAAALCP